jgi:Spy/CpxP family protein refolding chaperone
MNRPAFAAAAMLMAVGLVTAIHAQGPGGPPGRAFGPHFGPDPSKLAELLGLTDEQQAQLKAMRDKNRETLRPLMESARQADRSFRKALEEENSEATAVGQAALAMHAARQKLQAAHEAALEEMKAILTPEQREKLEQTRARFGPGRGRRPGGPRGESDPASGPGGGYR